MPQNIFFQWIVFQFFDAPKAILLAWRNFLLFNFNYFSIKVLFRTLFSYWHKYRWEAPRGWEPAKWLEAKASNFISRVLGAFVRICLLLFGIAIEAFIFAAGAFVFFFWLALPFILIVATIFGFKLIF